MCRFVEITIDFILWIIAIIILFVTMIFFIKRFKDSDVKNQRILFFGISLFFGLYGVALIFYKIADYYEFLGQTSMYDMFWRLGSTSGLVGFILFIAVLEYFALNKRTLFIATISGIVTLILGLVGGPEIGRQALIYGTPIMGILVLTVYLYLVIKGQGDIRMRALQGFSGMIVFFFGIALDNPFVISILSPYIAPIIIEIVSPIAFMCGVLLFVYSYRTSK